MSADLFTLLLALGLVTGPALAGEPAPSAKEARPFVHVVQAATFDGTPLSKRVGEPERLRVCFREDVEAGAIKDCTRFRAALKGQQYEMIVFAAK